jgi:hypothetical protein
MSNRRAVGPFRLSIPLITIAAVSIITSWPQYAAAMHVSILTLDSLIYESTNIIEAHIEGPRPDRPAWVGDDVQVGAVYQRTMKPGDMCVVGGLPEYLKDGNGFGEGDRGLGRGEHSPGDSPFSPKLPIFLGNAVKPAFLKRKRHCHFPFFPFRGTLEAKTVSKSC